MLLLSSLAILTLSGQPATRACAPLGATPCSVAVSATMDTVRLSMDGVGPWTVHDWLKHPQAFGTTPERAIDTIPGDRRSSQDEGLGLFVVVHRLPRDWSPLLLQQSSIGASEVRETTIQSAAAAPASTAPSEQRPASPTDFDFLEGKWDIVYNNKAPQIPPNVRGTWTGTRQADGRVLYDEFRLFGPNNQTMSLGLTYRIYNHVSGQWDMRYVNVIGPGADGRTPQQNARWAELTAWREGSSIRVDQRGKGQQLRITYYDITADHFSWKADVSTDDGKTWNVDQIRIEATRVKASAQAQDVRWSVGGATIAGTLQLPQGAGPFPAILFAPGSGSIGRNHVTTAAHAERLARAGFAVLTFDKRGVGQSSGDWRRESLADYAADLEGGVAALKRHPQIDAARVGLIGHSQGGWTAPLAARAAGIAFIVLVSATPLSPLDQSVYVEERNFSTGKMTVEQQREALALTRKIYAVYRADGNWEAAQQAIDAARTAPWFDEKRFALPKKDSWNWQWLRGLPFDFDVSAQLSSIRVPMLTINGSLDLLVPPEQSRAMFEDIRRKAGLPIKSVVIDGLHHGLGTAERDQPADSYWNTLLPWLAEQTNAAASHAHPQR